MLSTNINARLISSPNMTADRPQTHRLLLAAG
jgi:hypothetical protein